jgi:cell division protein FtsA
MSNLISGKNILAIIDIGTSKICVLVACIAPDGSCTIIGVGKAPSYGLKKGVVIDVRQAVNSIKKAVHDAQVNAGIQIKRVAIGISGSHIHSINSQGVGPITHGSITQDDIDRVLQSAKAIPISEGEQILHVIPKYYVIDSQEHVNNPLGMHGTRLEVQAHIILGRVAAVQNLIGCCHHAGLTVDDVVLEQLASAQAVLTQDECSLGVVLLDIGGGTSDIAVYQNGSITHTSVIPVAGDHFTNDIAVGLRTTMQEAERVKKEFGIASKEFLYSASEIEIQLADKQRKTIIALSELVAILEPRAKELFTLVYKNLEREHPVSCVTAGIVITGGGSLLGGITHVAQTIFDVPVRIGRPKIDNEAHQLLSSPVYATSYGLLLRLLKKHQMSVCDEQNLLHIKNIINRMRDWINTFF